MRNFSKNAEREIEKIVGEFTPLFAKIAKSMITELSVAANDLISIRERVKGLTTNSANESKKMPYANLAETGPVPGVAARGPEIPSIPGAPSPSQGGPGSTSLSGGGSTRK